MNTTILKNLSDSTFPDNTTGSIIPSNHRTFNNTLIDAIQTDVNGLTVSATTLTNKVNTLIYSATTINNTISKDVLLAKGVYNIGDAAHDWNTYNISIGKDVGTVNYQPVLTLYGNSSDGQSPQDAAATIHVISQTQTTFTVFVSYLISNKYQAGVKIKWRLYAD